MEILRQAAKTMAAIGDEKTLIAFNVYLANGNNVSWAGVHRIVRKYRDELKARLEKDKKQP